MSDKINFRALGAILVVIFVIVLIFSCAANKPSWGDAVNGYHLQYYLPKGETLKYKAHSTQSSRQEMMGQAMEFTRESNSYYSLTGDGADKEKNIISKVKMDSIIIKIKSPQGERNLDASDIVGKDFTLILSSIGKRIKFIDPESLKVNFGMGGEMEAERFFQDLLPELTTNPVKVGDSWTVFETDTVNEGGLDIVVKSEIKNNVAESGLFEGIDCLKISSIITLTLEGSGQQMGADIFFEGDGEGNASWYYAYKKGVFVRGETEMLMEGTATVSGPQNMTIPITHETKASTSLLN